MKALNASASRSNAAPGDRPRGSAPSCGRGGTLQVNREQDGDEPQKPHPGDRLPMRVPQLICRRRDARRSADAWRRAERIPPLPASGFTMTGWPSRGRVRRGRDAPACSFSSARRPSASPGQPAPDWSAGTRGTGRCRAQRVRRSWHQREQQRLQRRGPCSSSRLPPNQPRGAPARSPRRRACAMLETSTSGCGRGEISCASQRAQLASPGAQDAAVMHHLRSSAAPGGERVWLQGRGVQ